MTFETERLILRPWEESDAADLYEYAKDPRVGPAAGWPVHTSVENSRDIIRNVLSAPHTYAMVLKETGRPVGSIGLKFRENSDLPLHDNEAELGYWLGVPYWGQGLTTEAAIFLRDYAFRDMKLEKLWCGYYEGNDRSWRVQEKCGFFYRFTRGGVYLPLLDTYRDERVSMINCHEWMGFQLYLETHPEK